MVPHTTGFALAWDSFPALSSPNPCIITTLSLFLSLSGSGVGERDSAIIWRMRERQHASLPHSSLSFSFSLSKRANWIYDDGTEARISLGRPSVPPTNASSSPGETYTEEAYTAYRMHGLEFSPVKCVISDAPAGA